MADHPEKHSDLAPINRFTFDTDVGKGASKELELQINSLEARIDKIVRRGVINDIQVLGSILALTQEREDLEKLSQWLSRLAPLAGNLKTLRERKALVDLAINEPGFVAAMFGDLSNDVDSIIGEEEA